MEQTHDVVASDPGSVIEASLAAETERLVGTVEELWRYPVKSMLGGAVSEMLVTEQGGLGDRAWALRDQRNGRIVSAKRVPRLPGVPRNIRGGADARVRWRGANRDT